MTSAFGDESDVFPDQNHFILVLTCEENRLISSLLTLFEAENVHKREKEKSSQPYDFQGKKLLYEANGPKWAPNGK